MKKILFSLLFTGTAISAIAQLIIDNANFIILPGASVVLQGNLTSNVSIQGTGQLSLKGTVLQNIDMGGNTIPNLELDNTANATLVNTNTRIGNSLVFTNGKILTGAYNLNLSPTAVITGANSSRFVWTNGTGQLKKELTSDISSFELPVGENANYRPAYLTTSGSSYSGAVFGVKVSGSADPNKPLMAASYLNTYWSTSKNGISGGTVTLAGKYIDPTDITGTEANLSGYFHNTANWSSVGSTHNPSTNIVSALLTADNGTLSGINKFTLGSAKAFLQGAYTSGTTMKPVTASWAAILNANALNQPYNSAPFNYTGTESVSPGFFTSTGSTSNIVDWVLIELRDATTPSIVMERRAALIRRDGLIVDLDGVSDVTFNNTLTSNYHLVVRHRNHLPIRTSVVSMLSESIAVNYDFSTAQVKAYQNPAITGNTAMKDFGTGLFGMWGGNVNSDGVVRATGLASQNDYLGLLTALGNNPAAILSNLYNRSDLNMDGTIRATGLASINDYLFLLIALDNNPAKIVNQHQ